MEREYGKLTEDPFKRFVGRLLEIRKQEGELLQ
jgi:hypothetical protein